MSNTTFSQVKAMLSCFFIKHYNSRFIAISAFMLFSVFIYGQNDRSMPLNDVETIISSMANKEPEVLKVNGTTPPLSIFNIYNAADDHIQGVAKLKNGNYVFSHSAKKTQTDGIMVFARQGEHAIFKTFNFNGNSTTHPSAMQACGNIVAVTASNDWNSVHFYDASNEDNPVYLPHLAFETFYDGDAANGEYHASAVGLVYNEQEHCHYLIVGSIFDGGGVKYIHAYKSNNLPLTDPGCSFSYIGKADGYSSEAGMALLYQSDGTMYVASTYRDNLGFEKIALSKMNLDISGDLSSFDLVGDVTLSRTGSDAINPNPGFRWGGTVVPTSPNSVEVIGVRRLLSGGAGADFTKIKIWTSGEKLLKDCRKFSETCWLTSHNSYATNAYDYSIIYQGKRLSGQLSDGVRAFMIDPYPKSKIDPNKSPGLYNALESNALYLLHDPTGITAAGTNYPLNFSTLDSLRVHYWINQMGKWLVDNPDEILTIFFEGGAWPEYKNEFELVDLQYQQLFATKQDYDNINNLTLGDIRASGRRLFMMTQNSNNDPDGTTFYVNGNPVYLERQFRVTAENEYDILPTNYHSCDSRQGQPLENYNNLLLVYNHFSTTTEYNNEAVERWLLNCPGDVRIPNYVAFNYAGTGAFNVTPLDNVREFNRRYDVEAAGGVVTYKIKAADEERYLSPSITTSEGATLIQGNATQTAYEFILNDDETYSIRLKGTNRYLYAPGAPVLPGDNFCFLAPENFPDVDARRWYVEPLGDGSVRLFPKQKYLSGTIYRAMKIDNVDKFLRLSDNIDYTDVAEQKLVLVPVQEDYTVSCKNATVDLNENGLATISEEDVLSSYYTNLSCNAILELSQNEFSCENSGENIVTLMLTSDGQKVTCEATVTVNAPSLSITCPESFSKNVTSNVCGYQLSDGVLFLPNANQACGFTLTNDFNGTSTMAGELMPVGTTTITWTISNESGENADCSFDVTVVDNVKPTINCPNKVNQVTNAESCTFQSTTGQALIATASDHCGIASLTNDYNGLENLAQETFPLGTTTIVWTATDVNGNTSNCSFNLQVVDNVKPVIDCPSNITVNNDAGECGAIVTYNTSAADNCGVASFVMTAGSASGSAFPVGNTTVSWLATDNSGNTETCNFTVTVNDAESPVVNCGDVTVVNDLDQCGAIVIYQVEVGDNCGVASTSTALGTASGDFFQVGTTAVAYTATDNAGNSSTCQFNVRVNDTQLPVITCPANITTGNDPADCAAVVSYEVTASDNCDFVIDRLAGAMSGAQFPVGVTTNTFKATDPAGNEATCSFTVTVNKTGDPDLLYAYTVIGMDAVKLKNNSVAAGGVGVVNASKTVRLESNTVINAANAFFKAPNLALFSGSSASVYYEGQVDASLLPVFVPNENPIVTNQTIPDNSAPVTLDQAEYGNLNIGKNVVVTFAGQSSVMLRDLTVKDGATIVFAQNTSLHIDKKLDLGKNVSFDKNGNTVWVFVEDDVRVDAGSHVSVNIFSDKNMKVEQATAANPTEITGLFIARNVDANDNVHWNWDEAQCPFMPLPMNLVSNGTLDLQATAQYESTSLRYLSNLGRQTEKVVIERSANGIVFEPIFEVETSGTEIATQVKRFTDEQPLPGMNFYRAAAILNDGNVGYSPVKLVEYSLNGVLNIFPNPTSERLSFYYKDGVGKATQISVFNAVGVPVFHQEFDELPDGILTFNVSEYQSGLYQFVVESAGKRPMTASFSIVK
ncbi:MAG: HYR domain-containing protein [Bacteroidetes bacterium]|nr:HYR domain-containing protein [Bacteroidota bacterium]